MDKKNWKTLCMGAVVAIGGIVGFTSCENKNEKQDENKKPLTEQNDHKYKVGQTILNDIGYPTVKSANKAGEQDSILTGVDAKIVPDHVLRMNKFEYTNPTYEVKGKKDSRKVKVDIARQGDDMITETGKPEYKIEFTYDERTPEDSIREAQERIEALKEFNKRAESWKVYKSAKSDNNEWKVVERSDKYSSVVENDDGKLTTEYKFQHEKSEHKDEVVEVEFGYENALESMRQIIDEKYGYTADLKKMEQMNQVIKDNSLFKNDEDSKVKRALGNSTSVYEQESDNFDNLDFDASQEKVSAKQDKPEKKEPPKGSISKDAFINALLERKGGRGGKKS